jgi:pimeloyl-ACP methyl ester carboxylesterase
MTPTDPVQSSVRSKDGTTIAYERSGSGPALILVDAAGHYREFSSFRGLIKLLNSDFTVYHYDRRGRGASTDTTPYAVQREVEDIAALIDAAGGSAYVYGFSSGALLALHAAASGLAIPKLAVLEPPIASEEERPAQQAFTARLAELTAAGRYEEAAEVFLTDTGVPPEIIEEMRSTPAWSAYVSVAPTYVYDSLISEATTPQLLASVTTPTLVLDSEGSTDNLTGMAATIAGMLPNASHKSVAGEWHGVADDVLAPVLVDFFRS